MTSFVISLTVSTGKMLSLQVRSVNCMKFSIGMHLYGQSSHPGLQHTMIVPISPQRQQQNHR